MKFHHCCLPLGKILSDAHDQKANLFVTSKIISIHHSASLDAAYVLQSAGADCVHCAVCSNLVEIRNNLSKLRGPMQITNTDCSNKG